MKRHVPKSRFKAHALELFRDIERTGEDLVITDRGRPVLRVVRYRPDPAGAHLTLRETVVRYVAPTKPVSEEDWEAGR